MEKRPQTTLRRIRMGQIASGVGFVLYAAGSALELPETVMAAGLVLFTLVAVCTLLGIIAYPEEERKQDISFNVIWGQSALTILLGGCAYLTIRSLLG